MRREQIAGLSAEEIARRFALPSVPEFVTDVHVPAGTRIRVGIANKILGGEGGVVQYELLERLPKNAFKNTKGLP